MKLEMLMKTAGDDAWLVKIKLTDAGETRDLMTAAEYQSYVRAES